MIKNASISSAEIDTILPFLDLFEKHDFSSGEWQQPESDEPNCMDLPFLSFNEAVERFVRALYDNNWVQPFDWSKWQNSAAQYLESPDLIASADIKTIRKLLTTHVRKDRFCEGHVAAMFENGHIVALLRRLKELRGTTSEG